MIKLENVVTPSKEQWERIIMGMRNPKNSWNLSDTDFNKMELGEKDLDLMTKLSKAGKDHRKFMRMIPVYVDITANHIWWAEFDTYKVGTVRNSCSKMHKIHVKEFTKDDFSHEGIDEVGDFALDTFNDVLNTLEELRILFNETGEKKYWRAMLELLPMGFNLKATVFLNYEVLSNIYNSRYGHKMFEWHIVCDWIETLPYSFIITQKTKR